MLCLFRFALIWETETQFIFLPPQIALGLLAIGTLWIKRIIESPQRPFEVWVFDALKQAAGASVAHLLNMLLALVMSAVSGLIP